MGDRSHEASSMAVQASVLRQGLSVKDASARDLAERAIAIAREICEDQLLFGCLVERGHVAIHEGEAAAPWIALAEEALARTGRGREHPKARPLLVLAKAADTAGR
ncbi:MAG: hypothetical protein U0166_01660 [Acidobacteriota bacterium]